MPRNSSISPTTRNCESSRQLFFAPGVSFRRADEFRDGIDLDWEFPVGGGSFYKSCKEPSEDHLPPEREYEFDAYVDLVRHIRAKGPEFELSVAVPGRALDQNYFPKSMITAMNPCVHHFNLMSYDAMNRRDSKTAHHSGSGVMRKVIDFYDQAGMDKKKMCVYTSICRSVQYSD